jgi:hypothetical protein
MMIGACSKWHHSMKSDLFSIQRLNGVRQRAARLCNKTIDAPEGWSKSTFDPGALLNVFKPLHLKRGFVLPAYQFRAGGNGNGFVYALPDHVPFPEPSECLVRQDAFCTPMPQGALKDVMEAIEGDGAPWSYLYASILAREFDEFGAMWHGCDWSTHRIIGARPRVGASVQDQRAESTGSSNWKWLKPEPKLWLPEVGTRTAEKPDGHR